MGFGAIIAANGTLLDDELMGCVTEIRVEHYLDQPTRYGVRFEEDIRKGQPFLMGNQQLKSGTLFTIAAKGKEKPVCLVHGPIDTMDCSIMLGGPGTWFDIRGYDRRIELDRETRCFPWTGSAMEAIAKILKKYKFQFKLDSTIKQYKDEESTLNQRATDLEFINRLARCNNLSFWIEYDIQVRDRQVLVTETANVRSSPARPRDSSGALLPLSELELTANKNLEFRVNVENDRCQTVSKFDMKMEVERPSCFLGMALNDKTKELQKIMLQDPQQQIQAGGRNLMTVTGIPRTHPITTAGDMREMESKGEAMMTESGWFIKATASTTRNMLGGVVFPHDVINVCGLGDVHSGPYQVEAVTHVINAAEHFMDVKLRSNALGG